MNNTDTTDVLIVAGGTGGHIFPAINLYSGLKKRYGYSVSFISDKNFTKFSLKTNSLKPNVILRISTSKKKFSFLISFIYSFCQSSKFIILNKPKIIVGFGSYVTLPVLFSAFILRKKVILHESNSVLGKANRIFAFYAKKITIGMPYLINYHNNNKIIYTSNPVDEDCIGTESRNSPKKTILIFGGSQGAKIFSNKIADIIIETRKELDGLEIEVIQQCIKDDLEMLKTKYTDTNIKHTISHFFPDIIKKIKESSIIICRGGAQTIAEIISINRKAIIIPYPYAIYNHQYENAKMISSFTDNFKILEETDENFSSKLKELIINLLKITDDNTRIKKNQLYVDKDLIQIIHEQLK